MSMKSRLCVYLCALSLVACGAASDGWAQAGGEWTWQNPLPQGNDIEAVFFTDAQTGWAVGMWGTILHTTDGGATWLSQSSGTTHGLYGATFTDSQAGWAVGRSGTILHTTDGGATWLSQPSGAIP